jgi:hypothetical protein
MHLLVFHLPNQTRVQMHRWKVWKSVSVKQTHCNKQEYSKLQKIYNMLVLKTENSIYSETATDRHFNSALHSHAGLPVQPTILLELISAI